MKMKRIVVGVDGSPEAARALEWAADLAALSGAEIVALSVFDAGPFMSWGMMPAYVPDLAQLRDALRQELDSRCESLRTRGLAHRAVLRDGSPAVERIIDITGVRPQLPII